VTLGVDTTGKEHPMGDHSPLRASLAKLGNALVERGMRAALSTVDRLSGKLEEVSRGGGLLPAAAAGGLGAVVAGRNPIWGAVKGAIRGASVTTRILLVVAVLLALVLGPVALVLLLLALVVVAVVVAIRAGAGA
jgi:uncharacterized membrane protein YdbT with pleckstrin-like domain